MKRIFNKNRRGLLSVKTFQYFAEFHHIVFRTNLYIPKLASFFIMNLAKNGDFSEDDCKRMSFENCLKLFPDFEIYYK